MLCYGEKSLMAKVYICIYHHRISTNLFNFSTQKRRTH
ncbi:hypothetical protein RDI58_002575 [Solanum bulbocastanum]|uniref:Uncharacterized protein n=1 Tax=Solanum bulbocastanum TaxID=147425 RepID=A0AAN8UFK6_SOLBU